MIHREDIYQKLDELVKLIEQYDDNHPEVMGKELIAEDIIIAVVEAASKGNYHTAIGLLYESLQGFRDNVFGSNDCEEAEVDDDDDGEQWKKAKG